MSVYATVATTIHEACAVIVTKLGGANMIAHAQWPPCLPFPRVPLFSPRARNRFNKVVEAKRFEGVFLCRKVCCIQKSNS